MQWINAKERPPTKKDSPILVYLGESYGDFKIAALHWKKSNRKYADTAGWYDHIGEGTINKNAITHWMPLPEVPRGQ